MLPDRLIKIILAQYLLPDSDVHGPQHWARVRENGLHLASLAGADPQIIEYFAILHDCRRETDGEDCMHGPEAAAFARSIREEFTDLDDEQFELLCEACEGHTSGETEGDIHIQICWDADRLDLGRVGILPDPAMLCTEVARDQELIDWATRRAREGFRARVLDDWLDA